jgi:thioredoxin reductase (NADPH)
VSPDIQPLGFGIAEPPDRNGAFPRLTEAQREKLRAIGTVRQVEPGEILFRAGDETYDFFVVESGAIAVVQGYTHEDRVIAVHGPHRFLGELNLLSGARVQLTAVVRDAGEVIQVPADALRHKVADDEDLSNIILRAFMARRSILIEVGAGFKVVGSRFSPDTRRLREFLARNRIPYQWIDVELDEEADIMLRALKVTPEETPLVLTGAGVKRNPTNAEVARLLGIGARGAPPPMCDVVIVGGGPAGLAAAVYGASEGLDTQVIDSVAFGGQASTSSRIENYLGFPAGISGSELAERAVLQAKKFGARMVVPAEATGFERDDGHFTIALGDGEAIRGRAVVVATGARYRKLDVPELERFEGAGVYYAATLAEAQLCADDPVLIVGGGNSAGQAAMFMSKHAASCKLMIRGGELSKSMSRYLIDELERREQVEVLTYGEVVELHGEHALEAVTVEESRTQERRQMEVKALFVFIGADPHTDWLRGHATMDEHCFLVTGRDLDTDQLEHYPDGDRPLFLETSQPGLFAVGDVHSGSVKRCASAVGEGSMAIRLVFERLSRA